MSAQQGQTGQ